MPGQMTQDLPSPPKHPEVAVPDLDEAMDVDVEVRSPIMDLAQ